MAVTVTDNRTIAVSGTAGTGEGDSATNWTAAGTTTTAPTTGTASPTPREATAHIVTTATSTTPAFQWLYHTGTSLGTGPHLIYIWMLTTATIGTRANGGLMILIGDGTNRVGYHVGGDDFAPFRTDKNALVGYMCFVIDTAQLSTWPHGATVQAGARATLEANLNAITEIGTGCQVLAKAIGGAVNYWNDIIRHGVATNIATSGLTISGGTSGDPGKFSQIEVEDRAIADQKAHGVIRELATGVYGVQGTLRFGDAVGTASSWFEDKNVVVAFEGRDLGTTRYKIYIHDNGTGTATFRLGTKVGSGVTATGTDGCTILAATGVGWEFDAATNTNVTDVFIYGSTFKGATGGVKLRSGHEFIGGLIDTSGQVVANGATMVNTSVLASTVAADTSALLWNVATDPDTHLHGMTYSKGANAHHAIEFGVDSPLTMTLRNVTFTGFNASNGATDSTLHIKRTTGTVTINVIGGTTPSYKSDGATVSIVANPVSATVKAVTAAGANIQNARVLVVAAAGGPFPFDVTVTISRSGTTATVAHTSHGLATNDKVTIKGAEQPEYNGKRTITVVDANSYTYEVSGTPATPATGTIKATFVVLSGLTDVNGQITMSRVFSSDQPITGKVRKSTAGDTLYKASTLSGTVLSASGLSATVTMIEDT